jgi:hypothetical protein
MAKGKAPAPGTAEGYDKLLADGSELAKGMTFDKGKGVKPVVNGKEIMDAFGIKAGPEVGKMLDAVKDMMDENPAITKEEAIGRLKGMGGGNWLDRGRKEESRKSPPQA